MLDSARVGHKYRNRYFYAVAARLDRQRKKRRRIAVSSCLRRTILRDICDRDLFGRMRGTFARTGGTRHATTKGIEPHAGRAAKHKASAQCDERRTGASQGCFDERVHCWASGAEQSIGTTFRRFRFRKPAAAAAAAATASCPLGWASSRQIGDDPMAR